MSGKPFSADRLTPGVQTTEKPGVELVASQQLAKGQVNRLAKVEAQSEPNAESDVGGQERSHQSRTEWLERLVELVANGESPVPDSITTDETNQLLAKVGRQRRDRLVRFIARAIAADIHRSHET